MQVLLQSFPIPRLVPTIFLPQCGIDILLKDFQPGLELLVLLSTWLHQISLPSRLLNFRECALLFHIMVPLDLAVREQISRVLRPRLESETLVECGVEA